MNLHVTIRDVEDDDLPILFAFQNDPVSNERADFPPREEDEFYRHWEKIRNNPDGFVQTVVCDGEVVGTINRFLRDGEIQLGYWFGRAYWEKGIASKALPVFLEKDPVRPLTAHVVSDNVASQRVLEKCGFTLVRSFTDKGWYRPGEVLLKMYELRS